MAQKTKINIFDLNKTYLKKYGSIEMGVAALSMAAPLVTPTPSHLSVLTGLVAGRYGYKHLREWWDARDFKERLNDQNYFTVSRNEVSDIRQITAERVAVKRLIEKVKKDDKRSKFEKKLLIKRLEKRFMLGKKWEARIQKIAKAVYTNNYYLGDGFTWTAQKMSIYEQIKNDPTFESADDADNDPGGKPFIHNLGRLDNVNKVFNMQAHTLIAGETRVGKTVLLNLLTSQFIHDGEAVCIIDPKGDSDLLDSVYNECIAAGREDDFQLISLGHPGKSMGFDPLGNSMGPNDAADRVSLIMGQAGKKDNFTAFCWNTLATIGAVFFNSGIPHTLVNYLKYSSDGDALKALYDRASLIRNEIRDNKRLIALDKSLDQLLTLVNHPGEHFSKMIGTLKPVLTALATGEAEKLFSPTTDDGTVTSWEKVIKGKKVIYFNLSSMLQTTVSENVSKLVVQDLISYIGQIYAYEKKANKIKLICDEFYSIAYSGFGDALNKSGGAGLQAILGLQTDKDIAVQMDDNMVDVILGNLPNKIYLRTSRKELAERFTNTTDEVDYVQIQKQRSTNATPTQAETAFSSGVGERTETRQQTVVTPDMVMSLPKGQAFVYNQGMPLAKVCIPLVEKVSAFSYFEEILNPEFKMDADDYLAPADQFGDVA